jgi:Flp pilus assembly protein TadG
MNRSRRVGTGDRGATIVEFALIMPFLIFLAMGTADMGLGWVATDRVESASAQAARTAAVKGTRVEADRDVLVTLATALPAGELANLDRVVIFKPGAGGTVPSGCIKTAGDTSDTGATDCNSYSGATVRAATATSMTGFGGTAGSKDRFWSPASRNDALTDPPDYIGVWLRTTHNSQVGGFFGNITITKVTILRIQPDLAG